MKKLQGIIFLMLVIVLVQCAKVPMTKRSQISLVKDEQIFPMSAAQYEQVKATGNLIGGKDAETIQRVGKRIQGAVEDYFNRKGNPEYLANYAWEFNLIEDPTMVNAWCMPGGKVAFYSGILPICKNELGVAVVMGHEIAHAIANHGRERISQQMATQAGLTALSVVLGGGAGVTLTDELILQGVGAASSLGILSFSRKHESEADKMGLFFMAMAGYDPSVAPKFWERMSAGSEGKAPPEFVSTHPSHDTRISDLNKNMPKALKYYEKAKERTN